MMTTYQKKSQRPAGVKLAEVVFLRKNPAKTKVYESWAWGDMLICIDNKIRASRVYKDKGDVAC